MTDHARHDRQLLLEADILETTATAIGYLEGVHHYHNLKNRPFARANLKNAIACVKAAARSWIEMEALDNPAPDVASQAAE